MKLGYLVSQYPALSHSFVLREVRALRSCGLEVCVHGPDDRTARVMP